jgi:hypothetical protein
MKKQSTDQNRLDAGLLKVNELHELPLRYAPWVLAAIFVAAAVVAAIPGSTATVLAGLLSSVLGFLLACAVGYRLMRLRRTLGCIRRACAAARPTPP